jgi:hypothetical protein
MFPNTSLVISDPFNAVSDLVRRGLNAPTPSTTEGGLVVFQLPADSPPVTTEHVRRIEAEGA